MNTRYFFPPDSLCNSGVAVSFSSISPSGEDRMAVGARNRPSRAPPSSFLIRTAMRISRARWFSFLRRVFHYQNGSRSDLGSNPFNSSSWMVMEFIALVIQISITTLTLAISKSERPVWPMRIWIVGYDVACALSLLLLYGRYRQIYVTQGDGFGLSDIEQQRGNEESRTSHLMNKCRTSLELFFAIWFVMGNVWVFDSRFGSFRRAPKLHVLCISLLAWNAVSYSFPFLLFVLLCCCVPLVSSLLGYNMNMGSTDRGASDDQISRLPSWRYKEVDANLEPGNGNDCNSILPNENPVYSVLKSELLHDPAFDFTDDSRQWVERMLDYNVPGGKLNRGLSVIDSYKHLKEGKELTDDEVFLACTLGWCIEWLQAYFLVLDDIMDNSHTRRGQPCWFRVPKVGIIAANDGIILRNHIPRILKKHFRDKPYYVDLLDLFNEVEFQTASGQMIDLITTIEGEKDLSKYSLPLHHRIVQYKTAYYSFYLPVACALLMSGENLDNHVDVKNILIEMGTYFQVQDDYLDCFGDPQVIGKIGTDIEDFKCSWLVVKALERSNEEQKKLLYENYGKTDEACVAKVKELYKVLDLQGVFVEYESKSYEKLVKSIEVHPSKAVQAVLKSFLAKIYKRQK
ncbi:hypothetical protein L1049_000881 [Liquidambar formosana]|uniref:Uncharacterized protein n=1 Tax=Liquidambar formosana TaxID=63359 RepID=A0AAP0R3J1_LIQFO